jgi:glycolate oxidase iron-sulfur subunit
MREITWQGKNRPLIIRGLFFIVDTKIGMWALGLFSPFAKRREANKDLHLMYGCFERRLFPSVSRAVAKLAPEVSCSSDQGCCGALHAHNGELDKGKEMAKALGEKLPGTILTTAGGCAAHLASVIGSERVQEFSQWWVKREIELKPIEKAGRKIRVGLQDSCHLRNGMGVFAQPRNILAQLGDYVEIPGAAECCGAAGSYALLQKQNSRKVVSQKIADVKALNLDYIATVNPGCTRQLVTELRRARVKTKVIHLAELVAISQNK